MANGKNYMLIDKVFKKVVELGEVTAPGLDVGDRYKNSVTLGRLYNKGLLEREDIGEGNQKKFKYWLSEKGREINRLFGSYREYRLVMDSSTNLKRTFDEETELSKKIGEERK